MSPQQPSTETLTFITNLSDDLMCKINRNTMHHSVFYTVLCTEMNFCPVSEHTLYMSGGLTTNKHTWLPLDLMFSHFISHSPSVTHKGWKVLIEDHPAHPEDTAPPGGIHGNSRPLQTDVSEQSPQSKARLSSKSGYIKQKYKENKAPSFHRSVI